MKWLDSFDVGKKEIDDLQIESGFSDMNVVYLRDLTN